MFGDYLRQFAAGRTAQVDEETTLGWPTISCSKIEAAKRQVDAAVRLLFAREDALAVHTLAFAAFGLLSDLSKAKGKTETLKRLEEDAKLRVGKEFWEDFKRLANFLKHADKDKKQIIHGIPEEFNEAALLLDCFLIRELSSLSSPETQTLWLWHHALYFININDAPRAYWDWFSENHPKLVDAKSREEQLSIGELLLKMMKETAPKENRMEPDNVLLPWRLVIRPSIGSRR